MGLNQLYTCEILMELKWIKQFYWENLLKLKFLVFFFPQVCYDKIIIIPMFL